MVMSRLSRRGFAKTAVLAGVGTALSASRVRGANERVRVGFIGVGNRGDQVLDGFQKHKDCEVVAVCDLYQPYLDAAARKIGTSPKQSKDYRTLLDDKSVDAVVVATPDHWHALQTIHAFQAGKDVYVEKPLSLAVAEGRAMVEAAGRYSRVAQVGLMRRSSPVFRETAEFIRSGGIGHVTFARACHITNEYPKGIGNPPEGEPPPDLDWDAWLGPAPKVRYNKNRTFYRFRWFYDYSGGQLTNMGVHYLDLIHWALGQDRPLSVAALGGKFAVEDNREVPDTLEVVWQYPGNTLVSFTQINANAGPQNPAKADLEFRGTKGTLYVSGGSVEVVPDALADDEIPARSPITRARDRRYRTGAKAVISPRKTPAPDATTEHARNFLECLKSGSRCSCDLETGHRSTSATLLGNIAHKTRTLLEWDGKAERFTNSEAANRMLSYAYRRPYQLPT
jgi:predicted dehydrogenase